jgi:hypothetical protein
MVLKSPGILPDGSRMRFPKVVFVRNEMELRGHIERYSADGTFPIVQELVTGMVHNVCCFAVRGEVVALHQYHSVRRYRGQGVMRRVTEAHPVAEEYARSMLRALQWDGVAHVGFFIDEARDRPLYMETNGRFWGSVQGSIHAGWDIPLWVYRYFVAGEIPKPGPLKKGSTGERCGRTWPPIGPAFILTCGISGIPYRHSSNMHRSQRDCSPFPPGAGIDGPSLRPVRDGISLTTHDTPRRSILHA